jgi:hypothetical protein
MHKCSIAEDVRKSPGNLSERAIREHARSLDREIEAADQSNLKAPESFMIKGPHYGETWEQFTTRTGLIYSDLYPETK